MNSTHIVSAEDIQWLLDVHFKHARLKGTFPKFVLAILYGNEDAPTKVELFDKDHYRCVPWVYTPDDNGVLQRVLATIRQRCGKLRPKTAAEKKAGCL